MGDSYDVVIIGAGPSGVVAAETAALRKLSVALISEDPFMGYGLEGAFKSKSLYEIASSHYSVRFRWNLAVDGYAVNFKALQAINIAGAEALRKVHRKQLEELGVTLISGSGRFIDSHRIKVGGRVVQGSRIIIATGTRPRVLPDITVDGRLILSADHVVNIDRPIDTMLILGAGVIGCEFASIFSALGTRVVLVDTKLRIFSHDDEDVSQMLSWSFARSNVDVRASARANSVQVVGDKVHTDLGGAQPVVTDALLLAVGRVPNSDRLNLPASGVQVDSRGYIPVSDRMQTNVAHIYAVGDVGLRDSEHDLSLVHVGEAEGRTAIAAILGDDRMLDTDYVPFIIFTIPMVAGAGLTEGEARKRYGDVRVGKWANVRNHRSHAMQNPIGFVKLIVAPEGDDRVLGVRAVGEGVDNVVGEASVMIQHQLPYSYLLDASHAHPSLSESLQGAARIIDGLASPYVSGEEFLGDQEFPGEH